MEVLLLEGEEDGGYYHTHSAQNKTRDRAGGRAQGVDAIQNGGKNPEHLGRGAQSTARFMTD